MSFDYSKLRGRIVEKYRTQSRFAEKCGISRQQLCNMLQRDGGISVSYIVKMSELLGIGKEQIGDYFFTK